jgi:hypothetical protein
MRAHVATGMHMRSSSSWVSIVLLQLDFQTITWAYFVVQRQQGQQQVLRKSMVVQCRCAAVAAGLTRSTATLRFSSTLQQESLTQVIISM